MQKIYKLEEITQTIIKINPNPLNSWEIAAIIESLGYTDIAIEKEFGFSNALFLGQEIFKQFNEKAFPQVKQESTPFKKLVLEKVYCFFEQFFHSFIYSIPWIAMFILEHSRLHNKTLLLPPELAAPLSLALMMSLIVSGGFIQIIARKGQSYLNLREFELTKETCMQFLIFGLSTTLIIGFIGLIIGFYRNLFPDQYLIIAGIYYVFLSLLWMLCAIISLEKPIWPIPLIFIISGTVFVLLTYFQINILAAQSLTLLCSLMLASSLVIKRFRKYGKGQDAKMQLPRFPVLVYSLAPYFSYGTAYFTFLFADRITAGSAISFSSGLNFGLNSEYKTGMDLALLNFLVLIAITEYCHYKFMDFWHNQAKIITTSNTYLLSTKLFKKYYLIILSIFLTYLITGSITIFYFSNEYGVSNEAVKIAFIGLLGYFLFTLSLFNSMILFSLSHSILVLKSIFPSLLINLLLGYFFSHLFDDDYASIGFLLGTIFFLTYSFIKILKVLRHPDYFYYAA